MKDPLFYLTEMTKKLQDEVSQLTSDAAQLATVRSQEVKFINRLSEKLEVMTKERDRWLNVAGIMHEYLQEGDPDAAKDRYEQECAPGV